MPSDATGVEFVLHNFDRPEPGDDDPLSEELVLPEAVSTEFDLAPTVSLVLEDGRLTVLIRRTSRATAVELAAVIEGHSGRVEIALSRLGSWMRGAADWPYADAPALLRITAR